MPDLDFVTTDELIAELHRRLNGGAIVVLMEDRMSTEPAANLKVRYLGSYASQLGLVYWGLNKLLNREED